MRKSDGSFWTRSDPDRLDAPAREDLRGIREYIARDSARYARLVGVQLVTAVDRLRDFPLSGRVVPELARSNLREVIEGAYRIVYRVTADEIQVLAVVHGAREFPTGELLQDR